MLRRLSLMWLLFAKEGETWLTARLESAPVIPAWSAVVALRHAPQTECSCPRKQIAPIILR